MPRAHFTQGEVKTEVRLGCLQGKQHTILLYANGLWAHKKQYQMFTKNLQKIYVSPFTHTAALKKVKNKQILQS